MSDEQNNNNTRDDGTIDIPASAVPPQIANAPHPDTHTLKVNGEEMQVSTADLIKHAQKGMAADQKFQEAANARRGNERATRIEEALDAVSNSGDIDAFKRLGAEMGLDGAEVDRAAGIVQKFIENEEQGNIWDDDEYEDFDDDYQDLQDARREAYSEPQKPQKIDYGQLTPDLQRAMRIVEAERVQKIIKGALDKSDKIKYNMGRLTDGGRDQVLRLVREKIKGRLDAANGDFGDDGTAILQQVIPEVEELLTALVPHERQLDPMGLGSAPGGHAGVHPPKKPDHVSSTDAGFDQHILEDLAYNMRSLNDGSAT